MHYGITILERTLCVFAFFATFALNFLGSYMRSLHHSIQQLLLCTSSELLAAGENPALFLHGHEHAHECHQFTERSSGIMERVAYFPPISRRIAGQSFSDGV